MRATEAEPPLDETHDPALRSWVRDANGHADFPIQNLPLGVFQPPGERPRGGVAIGDQILDLARLSVSGVLSPEAQEIAGTASTDSLNCFLAQGREARTLLRRALSAVLAEGAPEHPELLHAAADCTLHLPAEVPNYTDFYAGRVHAENVGRLFRPDNPLLPNYTSVPIGYHGRASSVRASGVAVVRPRGQWKQPGEDAPVFGPTERLDFELELGIWVGPGNALGTPIPIDEADAHIAGYCLLNDWSARDVQAWEYQPLGPFLGKSFHTTVSPWVVTPEALAPFRQAQAARGAGDPALLPYLHDASDQAGGALGVRLEVSLRSAAMRERGMGPLRLSRSHARHLFWTPAQLVTHHASNGCNLQVGDLLGTGTISAPGPDGAGSLLELTRGGAEPLLLPTGERRSFLEDGDEVLLGGWAEREGFVRIGFGPCRAMVLPARG